MIRRHLFIERGGLRFGIFGLLGKEAIFYTSGGAVTFSDAIETAREIATVLRETEKVAVRFGRPYFGFTNPRSTAGL